MFVFYSAQKLKETSQEMEGKKKKKEGREGEKRNLKHSQKLEPGSLSQARIRNSCVDSLHT